MNKGPLGKILICVISFSVALCAYLNARNDVTSLMIELPRISHELSLIEEKNTILKFEVEKFENPSHLLNLLNTCEYAHLVPTEADTVIAIHAKEGVEAKEKHGITGFSGKTLLGTGRL